MDTGELQMRTIGNPRRRLAVLTWFCLAGLLVSSVLWLINLELAVRVFLPGWHPLEWLLPAAWFAVGQVLSADLSTISTLVPVLLFAFPLVQGWRVRRMLPQDPGFAARLEADPYPPHFAFFLVMLGLVGTLYGMMLGLDLSGVSDLAGEPLSQDSIRRSLDRLLGGTATALLSSLVGILGAFAAARPMAWLFRRAAGVDADVRRRGLSETVAQLTGELHALGEASRAFAAMLNPQTARAVLDRMDAQQAALETLGRETARINALLATLGDTALEGNRLQQAAQAAASVRHDACMASLEALLVEMQAGHAALGQDRESRRRALEAYIGAGAAVQEPER
jgi:hypothetical protein